MINKSTDITSMPQTVHIISFLYTSTMRKISQYLGMGTICTCHTSNPTICILSKFGYERSNTVDIFTKR